MTGWDTHTEWGCRGMPELRPPRAAIRRHADSRQISASAICVPTRILYQHFSEPIEIIYRHHHHHRRPSHHCQVITIIAFTDAADTIAARYQILNIEITDITLHRLIAVSPSRRYARVAGLRRVFFICRLQDGSRFYLQHSHFLLW